jgi:hypothetical protein
VREEHVGIEKLEDLVIEDLVIDESESVTSPTPNPPSYTQKVDVWALGIVLYLWYCT